MCRLSMLVAAGLLLVAAAEERSSSPRVALDLFVAGKCPDAARCELIFLPEVLRRVGSLVDLNLGFIAEEADNDIGFTCMHGRDECIGYASALYVCRRSTRSFSRV